MIYSINYVPIRGNLWKLNTSDDCEQKEKFGVGGTGSLVNVKNKQINYS